jgi:hypothetical protein
MKLLKEIQNKRIIVTIFPACLRHDSDVARTCRKWRKSSVVFVLCLPEESAPFDSCKSGVNTRVKSSYVQCDCEFHAF